MMLWKIGFVALALAAALIAQTEVVVPDVSVPGSTRTIVRGINNAGDLVGHFYAEGKQHGFMLSGGKITQVDYPGAAWTTASKINDRGEAVGQFNDGTRNYAFLYSQGKYTKLDCPPNLSIGANGINNKGDIVGQRLSMEGSVEGILWSGGACTTVSYRPDASTIAVTPAGTRGGTSLQDINDSGDIVGLYMSNRGTYHGLVYLNGQFTQIDHGGGGYLQLTGINNAREIAGFYVDAEYYTDTVILLKNGRFTMADLGTAGQAYDINDAGQIAGSYRWVSSLGGLTRGYAAKVVPSAAPPRAIQVDDDGAEYPGALKTIQEAVTQAQSGTTILVYPGTYHGTVNIVGPDKSGLKLIAVGRADEVVLQGEYLERDGFHLENVDNVLISGFTVRDFGSRLVTSTAWGAGNQIYLENAHYNVIEHNRLFNGDMMGIKLLNSGNNVIEDNAIAATTITSVLATCGIHVEGEKSERNYLRLNMVWGHKLAGLMVVNAGAGNRLLNNSVVSNGRYGIDVENTQDILVEGNRVSYNRGYWGAAMPGGQVPAVGINLVNVTKSTVFDNRARGNAGGDLKWDGKGENRIESNACETSNPEGACSR